MFNQLTLIAGLISITASFGAGWWVRANMCSISFLEAEKAASDRALEQTRRYNEIAADYEKLKSEKQQVRVVIRERIKNAKDSSFGCHVNADGMRLINDARGASHTSKPHQ